MFYKKAPSMLPTALIALLPLCIRATPTPQNTAAPAPVEPVCVMDDRLPAWHYGIYLDAHAPGVNTDCANDYLYSMQQNGMDITSWWCQPYDQNDNQVALADSSAYAVWITFWAPAASTSEIQGAISAASQNQYNINCSGPDTSGDKPDNPEVEAGESEAEETEMGELDPDVKMRARTLFKPIA